MKYMIYLLLLIFLVAVLAGLMTELLTPAPGLKERPDGRGGNGERVVPSADRVAGPGKDWASGKDGDAVISTAKSEVIHRHEWFVLKSEVINEAIDRLKSAHAIRLTNKEFVRYTGEPIPPSDLGQTYLIRGVEYDNIPGACDEMVRAGRDVVCNCRVNINAALQKRPIVVLVRAEVTRVRFVFVHDA